MNPLLDEPKKPELHNAKFYLKRIVKWSIILGALGIFCILYYLMTVDVNAEKESERIAAEHEALTVLRRDQDFIKGQVDRIVNAISNQPPAVIIIQEQRHHRHYRYE